MKAASKATRKAAREDRRHTMVFTGFDGSDEEAGNEYEAALSPASSPAARGAAQPRQTERFRKAARRCASPGVESAVDEASVAAGNEEEEGGAVWLFGGTETEGEEDVMTTQQKLWIKDLQIEQLTEECAQKDARIAHLEAQLSEQRRVVATAQSALAPRRSVATESAFHAEENMGAARKRSFSPGALKKSKAGLKKRRKKSKLGRRRGLGDATNVANEARRGSFEQSVANMRKFLPAGHGAGGATEDESEAWGDGDESMCSMR